PPEDLEASHRIGPGGLARSIRLVQSARQASTFGRGGRSPDFGDASDLAMGRVCLLLLGGSSPIYAASCDAANCPASELAFHSRFHGRFAYRLRCGAILAVFGSRDSRP